MKKNIIFYQAITQYENTGDLIISRSLVEQIRPYGKIIVNDKEIPDWYLDELGIVNNERLSSYSGFNFNLFLFRSLLIGIFNSDRRTYLFLTPGHLLGSSLKLSLKSMITVPVLACLQVIGCKIAKVGISLGPLGKMLSFAESLRTGFMSHYYVRDKLSVELAHKIGVKNAEFFPDLAWTLDISNQKEKLKVFQERKTLFISFRTKTYSGAGDINFREKIINSLDEILESLYRFRFFGKILVGYQVEYDRDFGYEIYQHLLSRKYQVDFMDERITINNAHNIYGEVKCIISNRLHVLIYGARYGAIPIPLIDIKKHLKIVGIFQDCQLDNLLLDLNQKGDELTRMLSIIVDSQDKYRKQIDSLEEAYSELSHKLISRIFI